MPSNASRVQVPSKSGRVQVARNAGRVRVLQVESECRVMGRRLSPSPSNEGCVRVYQKYSSMMNHISYGKCVMKPDRKTLIDKAKLAYSRKLIGGDNTFDPRPFEGIQESLATHQILDEGWALKTSKKSTPFTETQ